jgi:hypothetical protein
MNKMESRDIRRARRLEALAQGQKPDGLDDFFVEIVQRFQQDVQKTAFSILQSHSDVEDIVSETFVKRILISTVSPPKIEKA